MRKIEFKVTENGWITSNAERARSIPASRTECKKCGYVLKAILPSDLWNRYWKENHNCQSRQASRQAFDGMLGSPMDTLANLSIR